MTRYYAAQKRELRRNWKSFAAVFITTALLIAFVLGLSKTFSPAKFFGRSKWDSRSSFSAVLFTKPLSVMIVASDPKSMIVMAIDDQASFPSGKSQRPLVKLGDVENRGNPSAVNAVVSDIFGAKIDNYISFKNATNIDGGSTKQFFKNFASLPTFFSILIKGTGGWVEKTNITRVDMIKLWWQLKGFSIDNVKFNDFSANYENIIDGQGKSIVGFDREFLHREASKYLENRDISQKGGKVKIINASGYTGAGQLASQMASAVGYNVVRLESQDALQTSCRVQSESNDYPSQYLANLFNCDIFSMPKGDNSGDLTMTVGVDFAKNYLDSL